MKTLFITLLLVLSISLLAKPSSLPVNYHKNINLISNEAETELHHFLLHHQNNQQLSSIVFSETDFGSATLEIYDVLGKHLYSATVYLSNNKYDYVLDSDLIYTTGSNPVILLVKLTTKENHYLKKITLFV